MLWPWTTLFVQKNVFIGVVLLRGNNGQLLSETVFHEATKVSFDDLSDEIIKSYVDSGEPMDKAGGYGIQGLFNKRMN